MKNLNKLLKIHQQLLSTNPYCYFELAYSRQTLWMAWICDKPLSSDPSRKVITSGQGETIEEAASDALVKFKSNQKGGKKI